MRAVAGGVEVGAAAVGEAGGDDAAVNHQVEAHRHGGVKRTACPAAHDASLDRVDIAMQRPAVGRRVGDAGARGHRPADRLELVAVLEARRAVDRLNADRLGVRRPERGRVVEHAAAVVVDEALGRRALGDEHVVAVEFDVPVLDALDAGCLDDADAVDEELGRDQGAVHEHGVLGRHPEVARGHAVFERAGHKADRQHDRIAVGEAPGIGAMADPADRAVRTGRRHDEVAGLKVFHRDIAGSGADQRAGAVAGGCKRRGVAGDGAVVGHGIGHASCCWPSSGSAAHAGGRRVVVGTKILGVSDSRARFDIHRAGRIAAGSSGSLIGQSCCIAA